MRLAACYNVWSDGLDLLRQSIENISPVVDHVIVVWSERSNYGVYSNATLEFIIKNHLPSNVAFLQLEPQTDLMPHSNETKKRNFGIEAARKLQCTHFINMDSDEFYIQSEFIKEKEIIEKENLNGLVCRLKVLFKKPTYCLPDHTLVPFIQKLTSTVSVGSFKNYPFTYDKEGGCHIDPTRRPSHTNGISMSDIFMYHASWVRSNFNLKIENSSAKKNLLKSSIYKDLATAAPGVYNEFYRAEIKECENIFNLPML